MCVNPSQVYVSREQGTLSVPCRDCQRCRYNKVHDWIGRCYGEMLHSSQTVVLTLTYRDDEYRDPTQLVYGDVMLMLKRLRKKHPCRFICTGEYGKRNGRAHFHIILFFQEDVPLFQYRKAQWLWDYWPHGYVFADLANYESLRYVLKYVLKGDEGEKPFVRMSKKPLIGFKHIESMAERAVAFGAKPKNPGYKFEKIKLRQGPKKGALRQFWLSGRAREVYLETFLKLWFEKYGSGWCENNQMLMEFQQKQTSLPWAGDARELMRKQVERGAPYEVALRKALTRYDARPMDFETPVKVVTVPKVQAAFFVGALGEVGGQAMIVKTDLGNWQLVGIADQKLPVFEEDCFKVVHKLKGVEVWRVNLESRGEIRAALEGRIRLLDHRVHPELPRPIDILPRKHSLGGVLLSPPSFAKTKNPRTLVVEEQHGKGRGR